MVVWGTVHRFRSVRAGDCCLSHTHTHTPSLPSSRELDQAGKKYRRLVSSGCDGDSDGMGRGGMAWLVALVAIN